VAQAAKWFFDAVVYLRLARDPKAKTLSLMPLKDFMVLAMWIISAVRRTVIWRGHRMRVGPGSRLFPMDDSHSSRFAASLLRRVL
jgi:hypothetical protein